MVPTRTGTAQAVAARRPRYHHGDLERALLDEALVLVRARGAEDVSLRQVAQAVGVSPSAAYAHFPDKQALMAAVGQRGKELMDACMVAAVDAVTGDDDTAAVLRFRAAGRAYVQFGVDEPHLFRHMFSAACAQDHADAPHGPGQIETESVSYQLLCRCLNDLEQRGLLRPGTREGLDLAAWTMVHGFTGLVLDGFLPLEVGEVLIDALGRLALSDAGHEVLRQATGPRT